MQRYSADNDKDRQQLSHYEARNEKNKFGGLVNGRNAIQYTSESEVRTGVTDSKDN